MSCVDIVQVINTASGDGTTVIPEDVCYSPCIPMWRNAGDAVCIGGESKIPQIDGCGGSRYVLGGAACCIPEWAATGEQKCENNVSYIKEADGCGESRWVAGGTACCVPAWANTGTQKCENGVSYQLWLDGCDSQEWRQGGNACPVIQPVTLENTGIYDVQFYAPPYDGYWSMTNGCGFMDRYKVVVNWWETSPYAARIKELAIAKTPVTLREEWINGAPYLGTEWPASAGPVKMLRFDIGGTGPEVATLDAIVRGPIVEVFLRFHCWRRFDGTIEWCNGATTTLKYPVDAGDTTYLGLHSLIYPPQANGADYRAAPFMSYIWNDASGLHFVSVDTMYRNAGTSGYLGQAVGLIGSIAAGIQIVNDIAFGACGITSSRSVLEFDASCLVPPSGS